MVDRRFGAFVAFGVLLLTLADVSAVRSAQEHPPGDSAAAALADTLSERPATAGAAPVIDTVLIERSNVFPEGEAKNFLEKFMNSAHYMTRPWVIRDELLLKRGDPYDSALAVETAHILREREIFSEVRVDSTRVDDRLALRVRTRDGWSLIPSVSLKSAGGVTTWRAGLTAINFIGTGNKIHFAYHEGVDRSGFDFALTALRFLRTPVGIAGNYSDLSDGRYGNWRVGNPYRSMLDRNRWDYLGDGANRRVLQFFSTNTSQDTAFYQEKAFINRGVYAFAPIAEEGRFLRVGFRGEVRQQQYILQPGDTVAVTMVPDTVTGEFAAFLDYRKRRMHTITMFNGFGQEDLDLSTRLRFSLHVAPSAFGYERTGIGPRLTAKGAVAGKRGFLLARLQANGLLNSAGLDSGRVVLHLAFGMKLTKKQSTGLAVQLGMQDSPPPGGEFDLGYGVPLRAFDPHAFVGTREAWATFEHRYFAWDDILGLLAIGFAGFADYGGAWYEAQDARAGGDVGVGIRIGTPMASVPRLARLDLSYRFGDGVGDERWRVSFGGAFPFGFFRTLSNR
jgi:hypothetical protein